MSNGEHGAAAQGQRCRQLGAVGAIGLAALVAAKQSAVAEVQPADAHGAAKLSANGELDTSALLALARIGETAKPDQFSINPTDPYAGRTFRVITPVREFSYDLDKQQLRIGSDKDSMTWLLYKSPVVKSLAQGQNAYGVKITFSVEKSKQIELRGHNLKPTLEHLRKFQNSGYALLLPMDAVEAKSLQGHLSWALSGTLTRPAFNGNENSVVQKDYDGRSATLSNPEEYSIDITAINADITHVDLVNDLTGRVISSEDVALDSR